VIFSTNSQQYGFIYMVSMERMRENSNNLFIDDKVNITNE